MVNTGIGVSLTEILLVNRPGVVVAMDRHDLDALILDSILDHVRDLLSIVCHLLGSVRPDVVRRVVTSPENQIGLDLGHDE